MKTTKIALLLYNSILIFTLITTGFLTQSYSNLTPILLLIPVWLYFVISTVDKIMSFSQFSHNKNIIQLIKMIRILKIYSLVIVTMIIISSFAYSSNFFESTLTLLFLPLLISFFLDIFNKANYSQFTIKNIINLAKVIKPINKKLKTKKLKKKKNKKKKTKQKSSKIKEGEIVKDLDNPNPDTAIKLEEDLDYMNIKDHKRRQFLKIVGGGGVSMFLMLFVFQQKAQAAFFGSGGGPGVVAVKDTSGNTIDPAEKQPTDGYNIAELDDDASPSYYGFTHKDGNWYIAREESSGSYRYASGASGFTTNWTNRASLTYDYFDNVF